MNRLLGLDTETEKGRAVIICAGGKSLAWPETFGRAMRFLAEVARAARAKGFGAYNMGFDIQALFRLDVDPEKLRELGVTGRARISGWRVKYVAGKYFEARRGKKVVRVYDVFPFFQTSLDRAAKKTLGVGKVELPPEVDACKRRGRMAKALRRWPDVVTRYCLDDADKAAALAARIADSVEALGVPYRNPKSPASLARAYWGSSLAGRFDADSERLARRAFFGGRIEVTARGRFPRLYRYDLHSAYPSAMVDMVAPSACRKIEGEGLRRDAVYALVAARVRLPRGLDAYPLPVALPGTGLVYPWGEFSGVWDAHSWRALVESIGCKTSDVVVTQWIAQDDVRPFADMRAMYERRKSDPAASIAIKLILNSTYGLLAETVTEWGEPDHDVRGVRWIGGRWTKRRTFRGTGSSLVLAAHVTGAVRARVWRETRGAGVVAYMTDGVLCRRRLAGAVAPLGDGLGQWGFEGAGEAVVVGSGLYAVRDDGGEWVTKSRGWAALGGLPSVLRKANAASWLHVSDLRAKSLAEMVADPRARWSDMNDLRRVPRVLDVCFDQKRLWPGRMRARDFLRRSQVGRAPGVAMTEDDRC